MTGCSFKSLFESSKTYTIKGISVTMKEDFHEKESRAFTAYLESEDVIFTALKEEFTDLKVLGIDKNSTLTDYAKAVQSANSIDSNIVENDGLVYFTYEKDVNGKTYYYLTSVYISDDSFWSVNFTCDKENKTEFESKFIKWAKTVKI